MSPFAQRPGRGNARSSISTLLPLGPQGQVPPSAIPVRAPGGFTARMARAVRLRMPPVSQWRLHDTYWASRWGVRATALVASYDKKGKATLRRCLGALATAVEAAPHAYDPTAAGGIRQSHQALRNALKARGARPRQLRDLDRDLKGYLRWWKSSGASACALAAERALRLHSARPTRLGDLTAGTRRRLFRDTPAHAGYLKRRRQRPARLYKGRYVTYEVRYARARLRRAARRIISRLRQGQPVHARVLSGYLHRDTGRAPRASHSLVIDGYTLRGGTAQAPLKVDLHFTDPDGGGEGVLELDVAGGRFEHVPLGVGWIDRGSHGWDYDSAAPPYRYQVLSIR